MSSDKPDTTFENVDEANLKKVLGFLNGLVSTAYLVVSVIGLVWKDYGLAAVAAGALALQIFPAVMNRRDWLRASVFSQLVIAAAAIGVVSALGQGVQDVATTALLIVIFFASMTMNQMTLVFSVVMTQVVILVLALGQAAGWFAPQVAVQSLVWKQYATLAVILMVAGLAANLFIYIFRGTKLRLVAEIAEKEKTAQALKDSQAFSEKLFEILPIPVAGFPVGGGAVMFNKAFEQVFGYTAADVRNLEEWFRLAFPDIEYRKEVMASVSRVFENPTANFGPILREVVTSDGRKLTGTLTGARHDHRVIITFHDLTERLQAEKIVQASTAMYRNILEESPLAINITRGTSVIYTNPQYLKMFGYNSIAEIEHLAPLEVFSPECRPGIMENIRRRATGLPAPTNYETECVRKDGTRFPIHIYLSRVNLEDGAATIAFITDITEQKNVEAQEQALREKAEISSRLASIGEMASGIAHEINNPLASVVGFSELLLERQDLPEDVARTVRIIHNGSDRVKGIVRRMLTFARQSKPQRSRVDIAELIDNTLELRQYSLKTSSIEVIREFDQDLPWMTADAAQLQQVFLNLIINAEYAIKKARNGGTLIVSARRAGNHVLISFADNGVGLTGEVKSRLFQPFFTTKATGEGTGLGLSLSMGIIKEHSGTIRAEGEPGKGSTFTVELPIVQCETEPVDVKSPYINIRRGKTIRMLVVDDEPSVRQLIKALMNSEDFAVDECLTPYDALNRLGKTFYDVIFVDIRMPGMSGRELYDEIAVRHPKEALRVIALTGDTSDRSSFEFFATRCVPVITKPFDREKLDEMVGKILMADAG
jgi:PAS domain S-box-containing protein